LAPGAGARRFAVAGRFTRTARRWKVGAIALATEIGASAILIDDRPARRLAERAGLRVVGTLGLLLQAKKRGLIVTIRPELDKLLETSFFLGEQLYDQVLRMSGEGPRVP